MECPACYRAMMKRSGRITRNPKTGKDGYDATMYHCEADDIWITIDIPVGKTTIINHE